MTGKQTDNRQQQCLMLPSTMWLGGLKHTRNSNTAKAKLTQWLVLVESF